MPTARDASLSPQLSDEGRSGLGVARCGPAEVSVASVGVMGESVEENGHDKLEAQDEEEAMVATPLPTPDTPTRSEVLDHCVTHTPYRSWCKHCIEGRGREFGHNSRAHGAREAPTISFDYAYVGDKGEITSREQAEAEEG